MIRQEGIKSVAELAGRMLTETGATWVRGVSILHLAARVAPLDELTEERSRLHGTISACSSRLPWIGRVSEKVAREFGPGDTSAHIRIAKGAPAQPDKRQSPA